MWKIDKIDKTIDEIKIISKNRKLSKKVKIEAKVKLATFLFIENSRVALAKDKDGSLPPKSSNILSKSAADL